MKRDVLFAYYLIYNAHFFAQSDLTHSFVQSDCNIGEKVCFVA